MYTPELIRQVKNAGYVVKRYTIGLIKRKNERKTIAVLPIVPSNIQAEQKKNSIKTIIFAEEEQVGFSFPKIIRKNMTSIMQQRKKYMSAISLIIGTMVTNALNLIFNAYLGRVLSFEDLGLISLISVLNYLSVIPFTALDGAVNYQVGLLEAKDSTSHAKAFWRYTRRIALQVGLTLSVIWLCLTPFLMKYFQVSEPGPFVFFTIIWIIGFAAAVDKGYLAGRLLFGALAAITITEAIVKLASALIFTGFHMAHIAYITIFLGVLGSFFVGWYFVIRDTVAILPKQIKEIKAFPVNFFMVSVIGVLSSITYLSLDVVLAKHFLSPLEAGEYALISLIGKMVYFLGTLASQFTLPLISRYVGENNKTKQTLAIILICTFSLAFTGFISFGILGHFTLPLIFGKKSLVILPYINIFSLGLLFFALSRVFVTYYSAKGLYIFPVASFFLSILQFILIYFHHNNLTAIVSVMALLGILNFVVLFSMYCFVKYISIFEQTIKRYTWQVFDNIKQRM